MRFTERRFSIPFAVFEDDLSPVHFRLLCFLFSITNFNGYCQPGQRRMMVKCRIRSTATLARALRHLEKIGWIHKRVEGGCKREGFWMRIPPQFVQKEGRGSPVENMVHFKI